MTSIGMHDAALRVPCSAMWWGAYGGYQKLVWQQLDKWHSGSVGGDIRDRPTGQVQAPLRQLLCQSNAHA